MRDFLIRFWLPIILSLVAIISPYLSHRWTETSCAEKTENARSALRTLIMDSLRTKVVLIDTDSSSDRLDSIETELYKFSSFIEVIGKLPKDSSLLKTLLREKSPHALIIHFHTFGQDVTSEKGLINLIKFIQSKYDIKVIVFSGSFPARSREFYQQFEKIDDLIALPFFYKETQWLSQPEQQQRKKDREVQLRNIVSYILSFSLERLPR